MPVRVTRLSDILLKYIKCRQEDWNRPIMAVAGNVQSKKPKYVMTISRLTVDKLGVKLYDRVYAVIAELVSNSYDADATNVTITAPMGQYLASRTQGKPIDKGCAVEINDDGHGMTPDQINPFYLRVGAERRKDSRGDTSPKYHRKVMGNKGVGKLAPFGICETIEVVSSGGTKVSGRDVNGKQ